jgi:hypothetical protein
VWYPSARSRDVSEHEQKILLTVIVNGEPTDVHADADQPLGSIIPVALAQTHTQGQPPDNWELRDAAGKILDVHERIGAYHFAPGTRLFLSLKAGVGGTWCST